MSSSETDSVSVIALVVSLVALFTTLGQLLQQYFATADGFRRCQSSVMGDWGGRTHRRWRWRQFRFETLYTTPEIFIADREMSERDDTILILGDKISRKRTLAPPSTIWNKETDSKVQPLTGVSVDSGIRQGGEPEKGRHQSGLSRVASTLSTRLPGQLSRASPIQNNRDELVSWLPLLHWLHEVTRASLEGDEIPDPKNTDDATPDSLLTWRRYPALVMQERSWDFQPPDVIRPLAKTTVSDIAIMARRMGMRWKEFRPEEGIMRAEGHSHIITSTVVRSLGLVLQYSYTGRSKRLARPSQWRNTVAGSVYKEREEIYISTPAADRFGAGVIRGQRRLGVPDFTIGTQQDIVDALQTLDYTGICSRTLKSILKEDPEFHFPVADLVAMTTPMICQAGSPLVQIPAPSDNTLGITASIGGRKAFIDALEAYVSEKGGPTSEGEEVDWTRMKIGRQTCWVLWRLKDFRSRFPHNFTPGGKDASVWIVRKDVKYLQVLNQAFTEANLFFQTQMGLTLPYRKLLQAHLVTIVFAHDKESQPAEVAKLISSNATDSVRYYFDALPRIVRYIQWTSRFAQKDERFIVDAWMTMILRSICWGASHFLVPGERVPVAYFGSQLPVYIG